MENSENAGEILSVGNKEAISDTSLIAYLQSINDAPLRYSSLEQHLESRKEHRDKIESELKNALHAKMATEMKDHGFWEGIGYFAGENELPLDDYPKYFGGEYKPSSAPLLNEKNEIVGHHLYRERNNLSRDEHIIKAEIESAFNRRFDEVWFYVHQEINASYEEKVRNGEMAYLGERSLDEYIKMIADGLPSDMVEKVPVYDESMKLLDLRQKIYGWVRQAS